MIKLFVSHSSKDLGMAQLITDLLLRALPVAPDHIRCTSVPGFKLPAGAHVSTQIKDDLNNCVAILGLLTRHSLDSSYVMFELGAGWGLGKKVVPILGPDFSLSLLPPPLSELHYIKFNDRTDWKQLIEELSEILSLQRRPVPVFSPIIDELCDYKSAIAKPDETPAFQNALVLEDLQCEPDPEGWATLFRLGVRNAHSHKTIENVCIRVVSLVSVDGNESRERLPFTRPLLAITGTGRMPSSPPETSRSLVASDAVFFDFVWVHSHRKAGHSLRYGECVKDWPFLHQGNEQWKLAHDAFLDPGKYKVTIEVQGRDFVPVRKQFVFWGDKTGQHCVDANDPSAQSTAPLEFAPIDLDTLPAEMHPHQLRALEAELRKPVYEGMSAEAAYRKIDIDKTMCGLSQVRFVTAADLEQTPLKEGKWALIVSEEEKSRFPGGIPGFPNAIRRSDFDIAWQAVRGS